MSYSSGGWRAITPLEGMTVYVKSASQCARYRSGTWEMGIVRGSSLVLGGTQVVARREHGFEAAGDPRRGGAGIVVGG